MPVPTLATFSGAPTPILIVEDRASQAAQLTRLLREHGYAPRVAKNDSEALAALAEAPPELVLSDSTVAATNGYALCARIKRHPQWREIPVVLVAPLGDPADLLRGLEAGADSVVFTPSAPEQLLARLDFLRAHRHLRGSDDSRLELELPLGGRRHVLGADRWQLLNVLLSSYEVAVAHHRDLAEARDQLRRLNAEMEARAEAEQANGAKSDFLATMSHEIRTPMNGVLGMVELLAHTPLSAHQADLVATIRESGVVLLGLIDDILDFSKIEAGRLQIESAPLCLYELVESLCVSLAPLARRKQVELAVYVDPSLPSTVLADDVRLRQLLYNLIGNAIKFSAGLPDRQGRVAVRVDAELGAPDTLRFCVRDNGIGMGPESLARVFNAFTQAEVSTARRFGGSGLGLAICKRLVELMDGDIAVNSALDRGTEFVVHLPLRPDPSAAPTPAPLLAGLDCLLLAQSGPAQAELRSYLEHAGARVCIATDPAAVFALAANRSTPLVLIRDCGHERPPLTELRQQFAALPQLRQLLITRGQRRRARREQDNVVSLDGDVLRRHALLQAVAVAAGRASPELPPIEPVPAEVVPTGIAEARLRGQLVLVAEDDPINRKVIRQQLTRLGYAVEIADDGEDALQMWRRGGYGLILSDLHMPRRDGYELAAAIRAEESASPRVPILALTANALRGEAHRAEAAGMNDYLTKPIRLDQLQQALARWLPRPNAAPTAATTSTANPEDPAWIS